MRYNFHQGHMTLGDGEGAGQVRSHMTLMNYVVSES
jgi:hypothetical protein